MGDWASLAAKSPKINGVIERFNRTVREEFINPSDEIYFDLEAFQVKLTRHLDLYNNKRPHAALHYQSSIQFVNSSFLRKYVPLTDY